MNAADSQPLHAKTLWLTRPAQQSTALQTALETVGARVFCLPLLRIVAVTPSPAHKQRLLDLDHYDLVFYVSSNAARIGLDMIEQWWPQYPVGLLNFAVGPGTAAVLEARGLEVYFPAERMSSEAMLALPQLQDIVGKRALIVRGVGGREILAEGLLEKGCRVDYAELYARELPVYATGYLQSQLEHCAPDGIVISSAEAMDNLRTLLQPVYAQWQTLPLFVASARLRDHATVTGFHTVAVLPGASDAAIHSGLLDAFSAGFAHAK